MYFTRIYGFIFYDPKGINSSLTFINQCLVRPRSYGFNYNFTVNNIPYELQVYNDYEYQKKYMILFDTTTTPYTRIWSLPSTNDYNTITCSPGLYTTVIRLSVLRTGRLVIISYLFTVTEDITSANDFLSLVPPPINVVDTFAVNMNGKCYPAFVSADRLKPNGPVPAGNYCVNVIYHTSSV